MGLEYLWLMIIILLSIIEVATADLVTIWFITSAIISLVLAYIGLDFSVQFAVFVILGIVLFVSTRKYLLKLLPKNTEKTNLDRIVGMEGLVTEKITKHNPGEVKVDGKRWTAISEKTIQEGKTVKIIKIEGVKILVEEVK